MKAVVLAAGRSKRMWPILEKNFIGFCGKPLLQWQIESLARAGVREIALVYGAHNENLVRALVENLQESENLDTSGLSLKISCFEQKNLDAGMCGAVLASEEFIAGEEFLLLSGNDVLADDAFELILNEAEKNSTVSGLLLGKKVEAYFPGGYLSLKNEGEETDLIASIVEKPEPGTEPSDMVNLVLHFHRDSQALLKALKEAHSEKDDLYEVALQNLLLAGKKFKAVRYEGFWQALKFPWHLKKVFLGILKNSIMGDRVEPKIEDGVTIEEGAVIRGTVFIDQGAKIMSGAVIQGPTYIGKNSVVATGSLVREAHIGEDCVIGFASEVARTFLAAGVWTHSNYLGDSVIGENVSFGAGTVTGNLRLDEEEVGTSGEKKLGLICGDNVRVGVNTSFMPGVKIGGGSLIGAGIVVASDIEEQSFVRGEWELKISKNLKPIKKRK